jgi:DNA-binding HxlR family transcriptional regulator
MKKKNDEREGSAGYILDSLLTAEIRFFIMTILAMYDTADFNFLKNELSASDGNLSVNLTKLEEAGYISSKKQFVGKKPKSTYKITRLGLDRLSQHINKIDSFKQLLDIKE